MILIGFNQPLLGRVMFWKLEDCAVSAVDPAKCTPVVSVGTWSAKNVLSRIEEFASDVRGEQDSKIGMI